MPGLSPDQMRPEHGAQVDGLVATSGIAVEGYHIGVVKLP